MRFAFRLEKILTLRHRQREQATLRHAEARRRLEEAEARLAQLIRALTSTQAELDEVKRKNRVTHELLHYHMLHCAGVDHDIHRTQAEVAEANRAAERTAAELIEAHRAAEILEKLKERDQESWREEQARRERDEMDEVAVSRHRMKEENHGP